MAPVFSKNAILVGTVDYFCLVCEAHLKSERDTTVHISKPVHQKQLEAILYVDEFKSDGIKKIKNKYFCELCNKLLTVLARVRLHITEQTHIDNKNVCPLKRVGNTVVAFNKVAISDAAWNGLSENSCAICNIEYDNEDLHKNETTHILNIVQIQVEFDSEQNVYRKIDEFSFHCLTCNTVLGLNSLTSHLTSDEHKQLYQACCEAYAKMHVNDDKTADESPAVKMVENSVTTFGKQITNNNVPKPKLVENSVTFGKQITNNNDSKPKQDDEKKLPEVDSKSRTDQKEKEKPTPLHIEQTSVNKAKERAIINKSECYDSFEEEDKILKVLGCKNYITKDENGKTWCILCDWVMAPVDANRHVNGIHHLTILKLHKDRLRKMRNNNNDAQKTNETQKDKDTETLKCNETYKNKEMQKNDTVNPDSDLILEKINDLQKHDINVNFERSTVFCKKCITHINFVYKDIENHIEEHKEVKKEIKTKDDVFELSKTETKTTLFTSPVHLKRDIAEKKNNKETPNKTKKASESDLFEKTKQADILKALSSNKENVPKNSENSKPMPVLQVMSPKAKKPKTVDLIRVRTEDFVEKIVAMDYLMFKDAIINDKYCVNFFCFCFLVQLGPDLFRCQICESCLQINQFQEHYHTHANMVVNIPVICNDDTEFIREIRPGSFQCGFCNWVETSWESMEGHVKSSAHKECKTAAAWRREMYQSSLDRDSLNRMVSDNLVLDALINRFF